MNILKKKKITTNNNYLDIYKSYLKNLNFFNKFKKRNNILLKDILLLKLDDLYLLNINLKDNFFFSDIEENENYYNNKNNLLYFLEYYDNLLKEIEINIKYPNFIYNKYYINFLNKKLKKYYICKFFIQKKNKITKFYRTKFNFCYNKLKGIAIKRLKKKNVMIGFFGKRFIIKNNILYKKKKRKKIKNMYLRRRLKFIFSFFNRYKKSFHNKQIILNSKIKFREKIIFLREKDQLKFYFSKKKRKINKQRISLNKKKINFKNLNKIIFIKNFKNLKKIY